MGPIFSSFRGVSVGSGHVIGWTILTFLWTRLSFLSCFRGIVVLLKRPPLFHLPHAGGWLQIFIKMYSTFNFISTALNPNNSRLKAQILSSCCTDFMCFKPATIWRHIKHFYKYMHQNLDTTEISQWLLRVGVVIDRNQSQCSVSWIKTQRIFCSCSSIVAFKPPHLFIHSCQSVSFPISFRQDLIFQTEQVMKY